MKTDAKSFGYRCAVRMVASLSGCTGVVIICYVTYLQGNIRRWLGTDFFAGARMSGGRDRVITDLLKPIRQNHHVPAIAGAIVTSRGIGNFGVVGVRKTGTQAAVARDNKWHLGSDTKAMTATLVGSLVDRGLLRWDTTVADVFPDLASGFHPGAKEITVRELLSHHAGLPENLNWQAISAKGTIQEQRRLAVVQGILGKSQLYSRQQVPLFQFRLRGYRCHHRKGNEDIMGGTQSQQRLFKPLKMNSVGFGGTGTLGQIDQEPWSHSSNGQPAPTNGRSVDNPPVMAPAGCVHCTIQDWAKFVADQFRGARGEPALLKRVHLPSLAHAALRRRLCTRVDRNPTTLGRRHSPQPLWLKYMENSAQCMGRSKEGFRCSGVRESGWRYCFSGK